MTRARFYSLGSRRRCLHAADDSSGRRRDDLVDVLDDGKEQGVIVSLTRWVLRHRLVVVLSWLVLMVGGGVAAGSLGKALSNNFSIPGAAIATNNRIAHEFGTGGSPLVPVVTVSSGDLRGPALARQVDAAVARVAASVPGSRIASLQTTGDPAFLSADHRTEYALIYTPSGGQGQIPQGLIDSAQRAAASVTVAGARVNVTGMDALRSAGTQGKGGNGVVVEAMLGALGALVVLAFVFASFIAIVPLINAAVAILSTLLIVRGLAAISSVSMIVQFLIALIGLGVAIDYSLLVIVRWREERAKGLANHDAVVAAMATAGRAVMFSGLTVGVGLLALLVLPVPFLRSVGVAGMLIPLVSVAVALTLLPVILSSIGPRLDWPRIRHEGRTSRGWLAWGRLVTRHRVPAAALGIGVLVALVLAATGIHFGNVAPDSMAKQGPARAGLVALERSGIGAGSLSPIEALMPVADASATAARLARVPGVHAAIAPAGGAWQRGGEAVVDVLPTADPSSGNGDGTLARVRAAARSQVKIGGAQAANDDFVSAVYGSFPEMIAIIALLTFVLLARAFGSILLPLKAIVLNIVSVAAAWGVMTLVWQHGYGSQALFGIPATGTITQWVPLMMFAFLFGLSMDYEVFILARMREEYDATGSTREAAVQGIARTGRLVTSAALILFLSFVAMATGPATDIKILATGLGAGILLDATVVRALLVPALVTLFGRWNWWMPRILASRGRTGVVSAPIGLGRTVDERPALATESR
jgi:RND superfamily putative drug exporter